jgi:hypothetical protein
MSPSYKEVQWVVQQNLTSKKDFEGLKNACKKLGIDFISINIVPFSSEIPAFEKEKRSILYGSTTFNALAYNEETLREGIFFDETSFSIENYFNEWKTYMLNYGSQICTFRELLNRELDSDKLLLSGQTMTVNLFQVMLSRLVKSKSGIINWLPFQIPIFLWIVKS